MRRNLSMGRSNDCAWLLRPLAKLQAVIQHICIYIYIYNSLQFCIYIYIHTILYIYIYQIHSDPIGFRSMNSMLDDLVRSTFRRRFGQMYSRCMDRFDWKQHCGWIHIIIFWCKKKDSYFLRVIRHSNRHSILYIHILMYMLTFCLTFHLTYILTFYLAWCEAWGGREGEGEEPCRLI